MLEKQAGCWGVSAFLKSTLAVLILLCGGVLSGNANALVGGGGPDVIACFTQNLGGGSATVALPPADVNNPNYISSVAGTLITFDPSCSYLPVSPNPNQTYLYQFTWDFGDPTPDLTVIPVNGPIDPTIPANLAVLMQTVAKPYLNQGVYGPVNLGNPAGPPATLLLGPKLTIQQFVQTSVTINGTATNNSAVLTGVSSTTGIAVGGVISGVGVQANTTVISFSANTITMSNPAVLSIPIVGNGTIGSAVITGISNTAGLAVGAGVTGPGVPAGTTLVSLTGNSIALSKSLTVSTVGGTFLINAVQGPYTITLTQPGESNTATSTVTITVANFPPVPVLQNIGSQPLPGVNGTPLTITASNSSDPDGYILWAAIDWGDGTTQLVPQPTGPALPAPGGQLPFVQPPAFIALLPNPPAIPNNNGFDTPGIPISHLYLSPGTYVVTLSVIDNGRLVPNKNVTPNPTPPPSNIPPQIPYIALPGQPAFVVPSSTDPKAALASIQQFHELATTYGQEALPNHNFDPQLAQTYLTVNVPGNLESSKSTFGVDFRKANNDKLTLALQLNDTTPIDTLANSVVVVSIRSRLSRPTDPAAFTTTFNTDFRSRAKSSKSSFSFDAKKKVITLTLNGVALHDNTTGGALLLKNQTIDNGSEDVRVSITINGGASIVTFVRYEYTSQAGSQGKGKAGHSIPGGNIP